MSGRRAPALRTAGWLNADEPLSLEQSSGKVVMIEAFQMLCPGCVSHGLPLADRVHKTFGRDDVVVIGLHSVFEHHAVQGTREALEAFLHEYGYGFPVAIDRPSEQGDIPQTMEAYGMRGTPTLILIDRQGRLRRKRFGHVPDLELGADITSLLQEGDTHTSTSGSRAPAGSCDTSGCVVDYQPSGRNK